ncbi:hypothetical protein Tsubulata_047402 [Turnera subulata]|uniref:Uncharacterized protein n=1 Tax=Turnera subulata TaxID=218843 RepID=A0A9Q0F2I2_9ROSI|nr:hypothetical protein Tsubulata_047402 [Turnera subulata]
MRRRDSKPVLHLGYAFQASSVKMRESAGANVVEMASETGKGYAIQVRDVHFILGNVSEAVYMQHLMGIDGVIVVLVQEITEAVSDMI